MKQDRCQVSKGSANENQVFLPLRLGKSDGDMVTSDDDPVNLGSTVPAMIYFECRALAALI